MTATVEPMPSMATRGRIGVGSGPGLSQCMNVVKEDPLEWNVIVKVPGDEDVDGKEFDISALDEEDLCRLKTDDPFLYHSIPSLRRSTYLFDDREEEDAIMTENSSSSRRSSPPSAFRPRHGDSYKSLLEKARQRDSIVRRVSRLSTEAHPSLILEEMMLLEFQEMNDGHTDDEMDLGVTVAELEQMFADLNDQRGVQ
jgi:hypothetical protein